MLDELEMIFEVIVSFIVVIIIDVLVVIFFIWAIFSVFRYENNNTNNNTNKEVVDYDTYQKTINPYFNQDTQEIEKDEKNDSDDTYIIVPKYNSDYEPGKLNPFAAYE